jgi:hypothetical protein
MDSIDQLLRERLESTFKVYLNHTLEHALKKELSEGDILQIIINAQAALELLSKLYILNNKGWRGIVDKKLHLEPADKVAKAIKSGSARTNQYEEIKKSVLRFIDLTDDDVELLKKFQDYRNQAMHLGIVGPSLEIASLAITLVVRIFHRLEWQRSLRHIDAYMANSMQAILGYSLYQKLMKTPVYLAEAMDMAYGVGLGDVKCCIECGNESWAETDDRFLTCFTCGYKGPVDAYAFIDCPKCKRVGALVYDPLNIQENRSLNGKCCSCKEFTEVSYCNECESVFPTDLGCDRCRE